jgi:hypothetical protein
MFRHVEVNNSPPVVGKHDEDEQHPKSRSPDDEKVDRYQISNMLVWECSPRRRRRPGSLGLILFYCRLGNLDSKHWISATIFGEPHVGLASHIRSMRFLSSGESEVGLLYSTD